MRRGHVGAHTTKYGIILGKIREGLHVYPPHNAANVRVYTLIDQFAFVSPSIPLQRPDRFASQSPLREHH